VAVKSGFLQINLLPKDSFEFSSLGKFLSWAMSSGRVLVVLTEFVVLLAFGSRFYFDKKLNDVSETLDQKLEQISSYSEIELQMRTLLAKQAPISAYLNYNIKFSKKYEDLTAIVPFGVKLEKVFFDQNTLKFTGKSETELGFALLLRKMKSMDSLSYINIKDVGFDQNTKAVSFTIQANYK
jgi:hypothetical protein